MMHFLQYFQEGPADTTNFMIAGYIIIFGVMLIYLFSLLVRQRNLQKDMEVLEEIQSEEE
jgi:hypothetical protein